MLKPTEARAEEARKKARDLFTRDRAKDEEIVKEREKAFANQAQKTARLRALRLAREATDQATAEANAVTAAEEAAAKKAKKAAKTPKAS